MQHRNSYLPGSGLIVLLATVILFVPWLGETLFYSKGEPREAVVAVSILNSGNWTLPLCFGSDMPYKPPFLAWLIAILARVFNGGHVNEFIARLPSALALTGMIMAGYRWASAVHGKRFAMVFSFITMTAFEVFRAGMACRVDMVLTALMVVPIYIMYELREDPGRKVRHRRLRVLAAWLMLSGATLTKGPVGALLPCFAFGVYCLLRRDRFWPTFGRMISLALASFVLPAIWYYAAYRQGGQPFLDLMYEEVFGRLFGTMSYESHVNPAWYNIVTLLSGLLPWTLFLLFLLFRVRRFHYVPPRTPGLFCATVAITVILFYCIPESKRSVYLLPAYPFLCYGIACALEDPRSRSVLRLFAWVMAVVAVVAPVAAIALRIAQDPRLPFGPIPWPGYIALALAVASGVAWMANRHSPAGHTVVMVWALWLAYVAAIMPAVLNPRSDHRALQRLSDAPDGKVYEYFNGNFYRFYSLNYYLGDGIRPLESRQALDSIPSGSYVLVPDVCDTTGMSRDFVFEPLLDRSADHRNRVSLAIKK